MDEHAGNVEPAVQAHHGGIAGDHAFSAAQKRRDRRIYFIFERSRSAGSGILQSAYDVGAVGGLRVFFAERRDHAPAFAVVHRRRERGGAYIQSAVRAIIFCIRNLRHIICR